MIWKKDILTIFFATYYLQNVINDGEKEENFPIIKIIIIKNYPFKINSDNKLSRIYIVIVIN